MKRTHRQLIFSCALALAALTGTARAQGLVADAGADLALECVAADTDVTLDGTASSVGPDITYLWEADGIVFDDPTTLTPTGTFPIGSTVVTLTVTETDPVTTDETSAVDTVEVVIGDSTPPVVSAVADPSIIWPPNHKLVDVTVTLDVADACDPNPIVVLESVESSEADDAHGSGHTTDDVQGDEPGTDDRDFQVRAERSGNGDGRVYQALYRVTDASGNESFASALIRVPHDQRQMQDLADDEAEAAAARADAARADALAAKEAYKAAKQAYKAAKKAAKKAKKAAK